MPHLVTSVGMTTAARQAIPVAPLVHHQLQALINSIVSLAQSTEAAQQAYHQEVALLKEAKMELHWWVWEAAIHNQLPVTSPVPDLNRETDASLVG